MAVDYGPGTAQLRDCAASPRGRPGRRRRAGACSQPTHSNSYGKRLRLASPGHGCGCRPKENMSAGATCPVLDPFRNLGFLRKPQHLADYERHLCERDGALDLPHESSRAGSRTSGSPKKPVLWNGGLRRRFLPDAFGAGGTGSPRCARRAGGFRRRHEGECYGWISSCRRFARAIRTERSRDRLPATPAPGA